MIHLRKLQPDYNYGGNRIRDDRGIFSFGIRFKNCQVWITISHYEPCSRKYKKESDITITCYIPYMEYVKKEIFEEKNKTNYKHFIGVNQLIGEYGFYKKWLMDDDLIIYKMEFKKYIDFKKFKDSIIKNNKNII